MATVSLVGLVQREGDQTVERYKVTINRNEKAAVEIAVKRMARAEYVESPGHAFIRSDKRTVVVQNYPTLLPFVEDNSGVSGLEDLTPSGNYTGNEPATFTIKITSTGSPNNFQWKKNNGAFSANTPITGSVQALSDGVSITFGATTGHTLNDQWVVTVNPNTTDFYVKVAGYGG